MIRGPGYEEMGARVFSSIACAGECLQGSSDTNAFAGVILVSVTVSGGRSRPDPVAGAQFSAHNKPSAGLNARPNPVCDSITFAWARFSAHNKPSAELNAKPDPACERITFAGTHPGHTDFGPGAHRHSGGSAPTTRTNRRHCSRTKPIAHCFPGGPHAAPGTDTHPTITDTNADTNAQSDGNNHPYSHSNARTAFTDGYNYPTNANAPSGAERSGYLYPVVSNPRQ